MKLLDSVRIRRALLAGVIAAALTQIPGATLSLAQETSPFAAGDRVEADVNMTDDPEYQKWLPGTVTEISMWQGMVAGIFVQLDDSYVHSTSAQYLRPLAEEPPAEVAAAGTHANGGEAPGGGTSKGAAVPGAAAGTGAGAGRGPGDAGTGACRVGTRVTDRENRTGVVVHANGPSCHVKIDETGEERYYLQWMLTPGGRTNATGQARNNAAGGALQAGSYTCWAANGTAGVLRLVIRNGSQYANDKGSAGTYQYDAGSGQLTFQTGPWEGFYGTNLGPGKLGLSSRPGGSPNTFCDRQ